MKFKKPSGLEIEVADNKETEAYCLSLGWEKVTRAKPGPKPKPKE